MKDKFGIDFSEASTWRGVVLILTALGVRLDPDEWNSIIAIGMAVSGAIAVFTRRHV